MKGISLKGLLVVVMLIVELYIVREGDGGGSMDIVG